MLQKIVNKIRRKRIIINYHQDAAHGWFEIPIETLHELGIIRDITYYSYRSDDTAYLEEDVDATILTNALRKAGISYDLRYIDDGELSSIRDLRFFDI